VIEDSIKRGEEKERNIRR